MVALTQEEFEIISLVYKLLAESIMLTYPDGFISRSARLLMLDRSHIITIDEINEVIRLIKFYSETTGKPLKDLNGENIRRFKETFKNIEDIDKTQWYNGFEKTTYAIQQILIISPLLNRKSRCESDLFIALMESLLRYKHLQTYIFEKLAKNNNKLTDEESKDKDLLVALARNLKITIDVYTRNVLNNERILTSRTSKYSVALTKAIKNSELYHLAINCPALMTLRA